MRLIKNDNQDFVSFKDLVSDYSASLDKLNLPYWIAIEEDGLLGLVVIGKEPIRLLSPIGTTVCSIQVTNYDLSISLATEFAEKALTLAEEESAAYVFVNIPASHDSFVKGFEQAGIKELANTYLMECELKEDYNLTGNLTFERVERENAVDFLQILRHFMSGSPDNVARMILENLKDVPEEFLNMWYEDELLYTVSLDDSQVGVLDLCPTGAMSIANIGVSPESRGKGYGREIMQFALKTLKNNGAQKAGLRVHVDNKTAIHLYESLGFASAAQFKALIWWNPTYSQS
ncbi:MAG: GNAT family N-acetyltransferase [Candidatus Hodarchaeota archaeon]